MSHYFESSLQVNIPWRLFLELAAFPRQKILNQSEWYQQSHWISWNYAIAYSSVIHIRFALNDIRVCVLVFVCERCLALEIKCEAISLHIDTVKWILLYPMTENTNGISYLAFFLLLLMLTIRLLNPDFMALTPGNMTFHPKMNWTK